MAESAKKDNVSKIYCDKCDSVFGSRKKYEEHYSKHASGVSCESCPIDMVVDKILSLFKVKK